MGVCPQGDTERSSQSEVGEFQVAFTVNQKILRLQIPMEDPVAVAVTDPFHQLGHELLDHCISQTQVLAHRRAVGKGFATSTLTDRKSLHVFLQIKVEEFEDEIEFVTIGMDDIEELDDVGVVHLLQQGDLPNGGAGDAFILGLQANLLQGDDPIGMGELASLVNNTVGT